MRSLLSYALCIIATAALAHAASYGIDLSQSTCDGPDWVSSKDFPCFASKGKSFAIIETWDGGLGITQSVAYCASQAHAANMSVSLYAYACPNCSGNTPPFDVFKSLAENLKSQGVEYTYLYFDIEECPPQQCWHTSTQDNAAFLGDAVAGAQAGGAQVGIYASESTWSQLMGTNSSFSNLPLWYAHYDDKASFSDFTPFGGWTTPHMKQYNDQSDVGCYSDVDIDYLE